MQIWSQKKKATKCVKKWIWEGLGLHLEGVWDGLGRLLGTSGRFLAVFLVFKIEFFLNMGLQWPPRGLLDRFWVDLGRVWGGFRRIFGGFEALF